MNNASFNGAAFNGAPLTDEEQYQLWLRDPSAPCMHIVEIDYASSTGLPPYIGYYEEYTLKLSDRTYAGHHAVVDSIPGMTRQIGDGLTGPVSTGIGELVLDNPDGLLDTWPLLNVAGHGVRIYHGAPDWDRDRFRRLVTCMADGFGACDDNRITVKLRPLDYQSDEPIQTVLIAAGPNANAPVPILYGNCFNIEPVLVDSANATYQFHDGANVGAAQSVSAVRDGGIDFQAAAAAVSAVNAGTDTLTTSAGHGFLEDTRVRFTGVAPPAPLALSTDYWVTAAGLTTTDFRVSATRGGAAIDITGTDTGSTVTGYHWTPDLTTGLLYLDSDPSGQLTMDAVGYLNTTAEILPVVLNASNVNALSQAALADALPGNIGIYVKDRANRLNVAAQIVNGLGAWYGYDRNGMFRMGVVESYQGLPLWIYDGSLLTINRDDITPGSERIERVLAPTHEHRILYDRNWTKQTALFSGVTAANRALYQGDGLIGVATSSLPGGYDLTGSTQPAVTDSVYAVDPDVPCVRANALGLAGHCIYSIEVGRIGAAVDIGDHVFVDLPRYMTARGSEIGEAEGTFQGRPSTGAYVEDQPSTGTTLLKFHTWAGDLKPDVPL